MHDELGCVERPEDNFVPGVDAGLVEADYRQGDGGEWPDKIRAIHSSAALATNVFGRWKTQAEHLAILGCSGFDPPSLERKCPSGLKGTPPNLDVLLESPTDVVGVECKLQEHLRKTPPEFSPSYVLTRLPRCEPVWWTMLEEAKTWPPSYFDVAQIIKHYLGLRRTYQDRRKVHLVYLYFEPGNAVEFEEYRRHSEQVNQVRTKVVDSEVHFVAMSCGRLWKEWLEVPNLREHAEKLRHRYEVLI